MLIRVEPHLFCILFAQQSRYPINICVRLCVDETVLRECFAEGCEWQLPRSWKINYDTKEQDIMVPAEIEG